MNLQLHLLYRIAMVALLCLLVIASYSLYKATGRRTNDKADGRGTGQATGVQLMLIEAA